MIKITVIIINIIIRIIIIVIIMTFIVIIFVVNWMRSHPLTVTKKEGLSDPDTDTVEMKLENSTSMKGALLGLVE